MSGRLNKNIGFSLIVFAFFFIFEPNYSLLDVLPDFIGHVIICFAIINMADINPHISDAFKGFRLAAIVNALKIVAIFALKNYFADGEQTFGTLIFAFVFAVADIVILLPAFKNLFSGLLSLGMSHDGQAIYFTRREGGKNATEKIYSLTVSFLVIKNIIGVIPEFSSLIEDKTYEFAGLLRTFSVIIVLPMSIVWLVRICAYFHSVKKDTQFIESISAAFIEKVETIPQFYTFRVVNVGLSGLIFAIALSFDAYIDRVNLLPDFLFYAVVFLTAIFLSKHTSKWYLASISSLLGIFASVFSHTYSVRFFELHTVEAIRRDAEAYAMHNVMLVRYALESVTMALTVACVILIIRDVYRAHSGIDVAIGRDLAAMKSSFTLCAASVAVFGALSALGNFYYVWAMPFYSKGWFYQYSNIISTAINLLFVFVAYVAISSLKSTIRLNYKKYLE